MDPGAWNYGVLGGVTLASALSVGWFRRLGYSPWIGVDIGLIAALGAGVAALVGARWFVQLPFEVAASLALAARRGMPWRRVLDVFAAVVGFGQLLGRFGCWGAGCCHGGPASWGLVPWVTPPGMVEGEPVVPLPLIEGGLDALVSLGASWALLRTPAPGRVAAAWFVVHGSLRFTLDFARADLPRTLGLIPPQFGALAAVGFGLWLGYRTVSSRVAS